MHALTKYPDLRDRSEFMTRGVEFFGGEGGIHFQIENLGGGYQNSDQILPFGRPIL